MAVLHERLLHSIATLHSIAGRLHSEHQMTDRYEHGKHTNYVIQHDCLA